MPPKKSGNDRAIAKRIGPVHSLQNVAKALKTTVPYLQKMGWGDDGFAGKTELWRQNDAKGAWIGAACTTNWLPMFKDTYTQCFDMSTGRPVRVWQGDSERAHDEFYLVSKILAKAEDAKSKIHVLEQVADASNSFPQTSHRILLYRSGAYSRSNYTSEEIAHVRAQIAARAGNAQEEAALWNTLLINGYNRELEAKYLAAGFSPMIFFNSAHRDEEEKKYKVFEDEFPVVYFFRDMRDEKTTAERKFKHEEDVRTYPERKRQYDEQARKWQEELEKERAAYMASDEYKQKQARQAREAKEKEEKEKAKAKNRKRKQEEDDEEEDMFHRYRKKWEQEDKEEEDREFEEKKRQYKKYKVASKAEDNVERQIEGHVQELVEAVHKTFPVEAQFKKFSKFYVRKIFHPDVCQSLQRDAKRWKNLLADQTGDLTTVMKILDRLQEVLTKHPGKCGFAFDTWNRITGLA